jgi:hypothetical protein
VRPALTGGPAFGGPAFGGPRQDAIARGDPPRGQEKCGRVYFWTVLVRPDNQHLAVVDAAGDLAR